MAFTPLPITHVTNQHWKMMVYSQPGVGKSIFAGCSQYLPTFFLDVDVGACSVLTHIIKYGLRTDLVQFGVIPSLREYDEAMAYFEPRIKQFGLLVVDSITELQRIIIAEISAKTGHAQLTQQDWGLVRNITEGIFVKLRKLPIHVVVTAHEMSKFDTQLGCEVIRPSFDGRSQYEYAKHLSVISRLELFSIRTGEKLPNGRDQIQTTRWLNCGPDALIHYKDRSQSLAQYEYPSIDHILGKLCASQVAPLQQGEENNG